MSMPRKQQNLTRISLDAIAEKTESNADQLSLLATLVSKIADQVSTLTASVQVNITMTTNTIERLAKLEARIDKTEAVMQGMLATKLNQGFEWNKQYAVWVVGIITVILSALISGTVHIGK